MSSTTKLLPCPFCSNADISIKNENPKDNSGGYFIECPGCGASTSLRFACGDDPTHLLAEQWNRRTASNRLHQIQEPEADIWPCVNIDVDDSGKITNAKLYSPGLPAGNHDVYPVRVPYMDEHTEAWRACVDELEKAVPGFMSLGNMNGIECAVAAIRGLSERAKQQEPAAAEQAAWHAGLDEGRVQAALPKSDYLEGVNIPNLREALIFLERENGVGEGEVGDKLAQYVNSVVSGVLSKKAALREAPQAAPAAVAVPDGLKLVPVDLTPEMKREFMDLLMDGIDIYVNPRDQIEIQTDAPRRIWKAVLALSPAAPQAQADARDALTHAELQEVRRAINEFEDCNETDVPYELLMRAASAGYLECTYFQPVSDSTLEADIDRTAIAAAKGEQQ